MVQARERRGEGGTARDEGERADRCGCRRPAGTASTWPVRAVPARAVWPPATSTPARPHVASKALVALPHPRHPTIDSTEWQTPH